QCERSVWDQYSGRGVPLGCFWPAVDLQYGHEQPEPRHYVRFPNQPGVRVNHFPGGSEVGLATGGYHDHPARFLEAAMTPDTAAPRWVVVVCHDRLEVLTELSRTVESAPRVSVLEDRRRAERRRRQVLVGSELRLSDRRATSGDPTQRPSHRLAQRGE